MSTVQGLGYLGIGVSNLREAIEFYTRFARLEVAEVVGNTAFLTGGLEHHWVRLEEGNGQGMKRIAYEVADEDALAQARSALRQHGIEYTEGGDLRKDRVEHWVRFRDPGGADVELYTGMIERGVAPLSNGVTIETFLHAGWGTANYDATSQFYENALGFKLSDRIDDKVNFYRAGNRYHHSLVLLRTNAFAFNHFCIQVSSLDDVMRFRSNAMKHGVALRDDILRHAPSGSISVYLKDEARGFAVEFCTDHPRVDDETHRPRILPNRPESRDVWQSPLAEPQPWQS
ncbi:VOC family protein [Dactylosporangium sp. NPDC051485]|uniref:VOC family protein n=1 Tax=Dactylosporangium sp. NPDC051485 TaxID=3154846 RepID=UPI00342F791E